MGPMSEPNAPVAIGPEHFAQIMRDSAVGMALQSPSGEFLQVNPALCAMLGRSQAEIVGCTWQELTHPDDLAADEQMVADVAAGVTDSYRMRKRYLRPDGAVVWGDLSVSCVRDREGEVQYFIAQILDVTESVQARLDLAESEARYRMLAENVTDVVAMGDADGLIQWISPSVTPMLGWQPRELVGREFASLVHPEDLEMVRKTQQNLARGEAGGFEARIQTASGGWHWILVSVNQTVGPDGMTRRFGVIRDFQERREAQMLLADREEHYRLLAENSSDVVLRVRTDGVIEWASPNSVDLLGLAPEKLEGLSNVDLVHPDHRESFLASVQGVAETGDDSRFLIPVRRPDGSSRWVEAVGRQLPAEPGRPASRVVRLRDVDAEQHALQDLTEARDLLEAVRNSLLDPQLALRARRDDSGGVLDFEVLAANTAALEYLGAAGPLLIGRGMSETLGAGQAVDAILRLLAQAVKIRTPVVRDGTPMYSLLKREVRRFDIRAVPFGNDMVSVTWRDVTRKFDADKLLADSERHYRLLAENVSDIVLVIDREGWVEWASPSLTSTLGWPVDEWQGSSIGDFVHPDDEDVIADQAEGIASEGRIFRMRVRDRSGEYHWVEVSAAEFIDDQRGAVITATLRLADGQVQFEEELSHQASRDPLTGLPNRSELYRRLADTGLDRRTFVAFVDVDNLKSVNDVHGHAAGDALLMEIGRRLGASVRRSDLVARFGGDEFLVVIFGLESVEDALALLRGVISSVAEPLTWRSEMLAPRISVGLAELGADGDFDAAVRSADRGMYRAKTLGGNRIEVGGT